MKHYQQNHYYIRNRKSQSSETSFSSDQAIKSAGEKRIAKENKYGKHSNLILIGENDRIGRNAPVLFDDESMQKSYSYGFYERGSRVLEGKFVKGEFTAEEQRLFGIIDLINNVPEEFIKNLIKYPSYLEGRVYQMGKIAYDLTLEKNISFEKYRSAMEIIYPEINFPSFEEGYYARQKELDKKIK